MHAGVRACVSVCVRTCVRACVRACVCVSLLIEPYANESSQICPFLASRPQFESVHHQNRRLSSHSYSHESVILFVFFGLIFVKLR